MRLHEADFGHLLAEERGDIVEIGDARHHVEALPAAIALAQERFAQCDRIERRDKGAHGQPVHGRGGDHRHLAHASECQLQRARDRRRCQRQHMHILAKLLEPLLVAHAEMLLLVDDEQAQILELDGFGEQRVRADHDVGLPVFQLLPHPRHVLRGNEAAGLRDLDREAPEALAEGLEVLAGEQRRRHHHRDLLAFHHGDERGSQRNLGLAEAHIAADEPVHRPALGQVLGHGLDAGELVVGLVIGEARQEFGVGAVGNLEDRRGLGLAQRRHFDKLLRHLANALFEPRLAALPRRAAKLIEGRTRIVRAVARQEIHVLDGQEQLVAARIFELDAVVRGARRVDGLQPDEAADAVIGMHHQVAGRQARRFDQHVAGLLGLAAADQPVAQDVLLGDDGQIRRFEPAFEAQKREADRGFRGFARVRDGGDFLDFLDAMRSRHRAEPLAGAVGPAGDDDALAHALQHADVLRHGGKQLLGGFARSMAKFRPCLPLKSIWMRPSAGGCAKGVNRRSFRPESCRSHSSGVR